MKLKEFKQINLKGGDRKIMKTKIKQERGITLIALVITIVVLLILAGVSVNAIFNDNGIIARAQEAQNKMDEAQQKDMDAINSLNSWIDSKVRGTTSGDNKIATLVGKSAVTQNTKAEDAYGNKITIPKGFKVLANGTATESATYSYSGDKVPAVQDGIVIENETDGNQFVWIPVGTIKNKNGSTNTITLGRYEFDSSTGALKSNTPTQSAENYKKEVTINSNHCDYKELITFIEGNSATDSTAQNATARNLAEFISTSLSNGGYYIARFEASGTTSKIISKYNQTVLTNITQPNAAKAARDMYGDTTEYASDLVNSYAWDTAIIFIQTYGTGTNASTYASENKSTSRANTGINNDKYCNIFDMSGNADEWTTEYSKRYDGMYYNCCVLRGGQYNTDAYNYASYRFVTTTTNSYSNRSLRSLLYVK